MRTVGMLVFLIVVLMQPAFGVKVTGVVVDSSGRPLAGAQVAICRSCAPDNTVELTADKRGEFAANVVECGVGEGKRLGVAYAYSPGYVLGWAELSRAGKTRIEMEPAGQIWGSVVDEQGKPVAGAKVAVISAEKPDGTRFSFSCSPFREKVVAVTTADGRWTIAGLPLSGTAYVELVDPRYAEAGVDVILGGDAAPAPPIVARPAAVLAGRVVYESGKPAAGIGVYCNGHKGGGGGARADAKGFYRIEGLQSGLFDVMARDPSGEYLGNALAGVKAVEGETVRLPDIILTTGAVVKGRVTDAETGEPIAGVYVGAHGAHNPETTGVLQGISTDAKGYYKLRVGSGKTTLSVSAERKGYLRRDPDTDGEIAVTLGKGEVGVRDIALKKGIVVAGTVVDEQGKKLGGVGLTVSVALDNRGRTSTAFGKSAADGTFSVSPLQPGPATVSAVGDDFDNAFFGEWEVVEPKKIAVPSGAPVKVVMRKVKRIPIVGRAVTPSGSPVAGVAVTVEFAGPMNPETGMGGPVTWRTITTNTEGQFAFPEIRPGLEVRFQKAEKQGYRYLSGGQVKKTESAFELSDIVMAGLSTRISGVVVDAEGRPVVGAKVTSPLRGLDEPVVTNEKGEFTLESLPEGDVVVMAAFGTDFGQVTARAGGEPAVVIRLGERL